MTEKFGLSYNARSIYVPQMERARLRYPEHLARLGARAAVALVTRGARFDGVSRARRARDRAAKVMPYRRAGGAPGLPGRRVPDGFGQKQRVRVKFVKFDSRRTAA